MRIPRFPIGAVWSDVPAWDERPLALSSGQRLAAVSSAAVRAGVRSGMTVAESRARCAALHVRAWDEARIAAAVTTISAALVAASPQVTPASDEPGLWWVGAEGLGALGGESELARSLLAISRSWHARARVALAGSCVAARAATWALEARTRGVALVPAGADAAYLARAPLALIPMEHHVAEGLAALGVRTAGALASLDAGDVERRWGEAGLAAWRLARGEDRRRPVLARTAGERRVELELPAPAKGVEPVLFLVRAALERLATNLVADGLSAAAVAITLTLDGPRGALPSGAPAHTLSREVRLPRAVARANILFEQCRSLLERHSVEAPICGVAVAVTATAPAAGEQGDLLAGSWRDPAAADAALQRLRAALGPGAVVRPVTLDAHRPERSGAWVEGASEHGRHGRPRRGGQPRDGTPAPAQESGEGPGGATPTPVGAAPTGGSATSERGGHLALLADAPASAPVCAAALRLLEAPEAVEVERTGGVPSAIWWRGERLTVERATGPERLSGEWWGDAYRRDYWRCAGSTGEMLLFLDRREEGGGWYLQGWTD